MAKSQKLMMKSQVWAGIRNELFEIIVTEAITQTLEKSKNQKYISEYVIPKRQAEYIASNCHTIFDNFFSLIYNGSKIDFWTQLTYYKGNNKKKEANKTYEARETIVESLILNSNLKKQEDSFRSIHITVGKKGYAYGWIDEMKENVFDLSINIDPNKTDVEIGNYLRQFIKFNTTVEVRAKIREDMKRSDNVSHKIYSDISTTFFNYIKGGLSPNAIYRMQASVIRELPAQKKIQINRASRHGEDIKNKVIKEILNPASSGGRLQALAIAQLNRKPFLVVAMECLKQYSKFTSNLLTPKPRERLRDYLIRVWAQDGDYRPLVRRLLLKLISKSGQYTQDLDVKGVTEHNLYSGDHTFKQCEEVAEILLENRGQWSQSPLDLIKLLCDQTLTVPIIRESLNYELQNGTTIKPSLGFVQMCLLPKYQLFPAKIKGYHASLCSEKVKAFDNLFAIVRVGRNKKVIAYLKAKYFRRQEFARRCKEESFISIMAKNEVKNGNVFKKIEEPFLMFIDKEDNYLPQEYALEMLYVSGWEPFFDIKKLMDFLGTL